MHLTRLRPPARAAAACLTLSASAALAQQTLIVTGAREPLAPERLTADVVVVDAATLRDAGADSLADLLRREAGVQLSRNGGPGQSSGLFIRGGSAGQTVVLVDGVRIGSATLGLAALETLDASQVERVEVLRGPGSALYGADAVGGVVQVFTRSGAAASPGGPRLEARLAAGGYGSREASATLGGAARQWDGALGVSSARSRGVSALRPGDAFGNHNPDADGHDLRSAHARLGWRPAAGQRVGLTLLRSSLDAQYDGSRFLPPDFAQDATPDFRNRLRTEVDALDWAGALAPALRGSVRVARSLDRSISGAAGEDRFATRRDAVTAQLAWTAGAAGQVVAALEHGRDRAESSAYAADVVRRTDAAVLSWTGERAGWQWQADLRRDQASDTGGVTTARLGAGWRPAPGWRLRALAGDSFRAPSFNDLVFPGYGVPTLRPERGRSLEAGLAWTGAGAQAQATLWRNHVRDLVAYQPDPASCPGGRAAYAFGCAGNVGRAELHGATLSGSARPAAGLALKAQWELLSARDADTGQRLQRRAAQQGSLGAEQTSGAWTFGASLLRIGARPDAGRRLAAETTLDLQARWTFAPGWSLQARLANAGDARIEPARDYQGLGRQAWLALRYGGGL